MNALILTYGLEPDYARINQLPAVKELEADGDEILRECRSTHEIGMKEAARYGKSYETLGFVGASLYKGQPVGGLKVFHQVGKSGGVVET